MADSYTNLFDDDNEGQDDEIEAVQLRAKKKKNYKISQASFA